MLLRLLHHPRLLREPALARRSNILNASVSEKQCNVTYQDASVALKINDRYAAPAVRRAAGDGVLSAKYIAPFQNVLYTGMTETNSSTQGTIGIAGVKGSLSFVKQVHRRFRMFMGLC